MADAPRTLGEFELIERYFAHPRPSAPIGGVLLGIGDDAALLRMPRDSDLVAAVDTIVVGRHFLDDADPHAVGHRALAVNLSDLAAMGAIPAWATLALTVPSVEPAWLERFAQGFLALADGHGVALVGGDTTAGPLTISVQLMGSVPSGTALRRGGARVGDLLAVTGTLGDAGAGLALAQRRIAVREPQAAAHLLRRFDYPTPRVEFGIAARAFASAAMDISDGLSGDLPKLCAASGVAARVHVDRLPLSPALRAVVDEAQALTWALAAGDDYELLLALPPAAAPKLHAAALQLNLTLTIIGELSEGSGIDWRYKGDPFTAPAQGFDHFR